MSPRRAGLIGISRWLYCIANVEQVKTEDMLSKFDSPSEYKPLVADLLNKNRDLFAAKDSDLTFTDTIKFRID